MRVRWTPGGVLREPTGSNGGQWGVTQDNYGKMWFQAGASGMPGYFQFPIVYGNFNYPDQFEPDLNITWGAPVLIADMQGGMNAVRMPDGSLDACDRRRPATTCIRGDRLPKDLIGDYFYGEAVGAHRPAPAPGQDRRPDAAAERLSAVASSSARPTRCSGRSTSRPRRTARCTSRTCIAASSRSRSGPGPAPTCAQRIEQYELDKVVRHGRIWRLTYDGMGRADRRRRGC